MKYQYIGVDLATQKLDVYSKGSGYVALRNDEAGKQQLLDIVKKAGPNALVAYESTGSVSKRFASFLYDKGVTQRCLNARRVYKYAELTGKFAKTDKEDCRTIYEYAIWDEVKPDALHSKFILRLREMVSLRKSLVESRKTLKNARHGGDESDAPHTARIFEVFDEEIRALESRIEAFIKTHETYGPLHKALLKEPGIGMVAAMTLIAYLPELGHVNHRKIAGIAGLAPKNNDSGETIGARHIKGGRMALRNELYMVQVASTHLKNWQLRDFYERKLAEKPTRVVLIACCRRWLVQLNAKVRDWYHNGCNGTLPQVGSGEAAQASPRKR